jgi:hypothetical protein
MWIADKPQGKETSSKTYQPDNTIQYNTSKTHNSSHNLSASACATSPRPIAQQQRLQREPARVPRSVKACLTMSATAYASPTRCTVHYALIVGGTRGRAPRACTCHNSHLLYAVYHYGTETEAWGLVGKGNIIMGEAEGPE